MSTASGPARRGTRNPELLGVDPGLDLEPDGDVDPATGQIEPERPLVFDGDVIGYSVTLAADLGSGKPSYIRAEHRTHVQTGESDAEAFARVATFVNNAVIEGMDDEVERLQEYDELLQRRAARVGQHQATGQ